MDDRYLEPEEEAKGANSEPYEVEVEGGDEEDLDAAMQEALEAVEKQEETGEDEPEGSPVAVADLEARVAALHEQNLRTLADFENYRKRVSRERQDGQRYAGFSVLAELLPLLDNLERALRAEGAVADLKIGVEMIARQFQDLLKSHGVERIASVGEPFDPTVHDAVSRGEDPELEVATVAEELQPGYKMGERLLRPASVRVNMPAEATSVGPEAEELN